MKITTLLTASLGLLALAACTDTDFEATQPNRNTVSSLAGDFSRSLIVGDFLYGVDAVNVLTFDISDRGAPELVDRTPIGLAVETIYHHDGNLFIGSRSGMYIYTISRSGVPVRRGDFQYANVPGVDVEPCDPVVAEGTTAYASLYTGDNTATQPCGDRTADFQTIVVLDVADLDNPRLVNTHDTPTPRGLAVADDVLFVCNNDNGLTVYDVSDRTAFQTLDRVLGINAWDAMIDSDNRLVVVSSDEVIQYDITDPSDLREISRISYPQS